MKLAFVVCNEYIADEVLAMLLDVRQFGNGATGSHSPLKLIRRAVDLAAHLFQATAGRFGHLRGGGISLAGAFFLPFPNGQDCLQRELMSGFLHLSSPLCSTRRLQRFAQKTPTAACRDALLDRLSQKNS